MLKIFVRKVDLVDKHEEVSYINNDDQDEFDTKDGIHERFFDIIEII